MTVQAGAGALLLSPPTSHSPPYIALQHQQGSLLFYKYRVACCMNLLLISATIYCIRPFDSSVLGMFFQRVANVGFLIYVRIVIEDTQI